MYRRVLIQKAEPESVPAEKANETTDSSSNDVSTQPVTDNIKKENDTDVEMKDVDQENGDDNEEDKNVYNDLIQFYNTVSV